MEHEIDKAFGETLPQWCHFCVACAHNHCCNRSSWLEISRRWNECGACAGINTRSDVLAMGIGNYNEECRSIVMRYVALT